MRSVPRATIRWLCLLLALAGARSVAGEPAAEDADFFERDIRPLLVLRCYKCHGDIAEPKGRLALTSRESVLRGGESGPAAVPGKPAESRLIAAINYDELEMPPDGNRLSAAEIARLTRWVERGLPWPADDPRAIQTAQAAAQAEQIAHARRTFWSFQPVQNPLPPEVRHTDWPRTRVDQFILAQLEARGLAPSPPADKRTLLRRLSFDLVGLPPTPAEVERFVADSSSEAVARVVDRLLASPAYGERWGRHWLDVARYADTKGYVLFQNANFPWSYTYRDYVVRSFNEDLPYDRFIVEQLAADQLSLASDRRPLTALGFLTLGAGFMNNQQDVIDDRIDVVTRGLLGLTVSCARCHDHKFDPIPTADYYALYGVFASCAEPTVPPLFEPPPRSEAYAAFAKELGERERKLREFLDGKYRDLIDSARTRVGEYLLAAQALRDRPTTEDFMLLADGADLNPTMTLRYQVYLERTGKSHDPVWAVWHALAALPAEQFSSQSATTVARVLAPGQPDRPIHPLVAGAFLGRPLKTLDDAAAVYGQLLAGVDRLWRMGLDEAGAAKRPAATALADPNLEALRQVFYGPDAPANLPQNEATVLVLLPDRPAQKIRTDLLSAIEQWRATGPAAPPRAMALEDLPVPVESHVFVRGNPNNLGPRVARRFLRVLCDGEPAPFADRGGRLELARAIASRQNPLTARVLVNRLWLEHFGSGLVATPSDFGLRSQPPSHPELLDYLASTFMDHGWSIKRLHREIVLSAVYQQASDERAECHLIDPENRWLWRMNRRRLDFEATRDALLAVAGRLQTTVGGPSVPGISEPASTRRTLYGHIDRLNLPGLFRTFDFPNPDATSPERSLTTIPQQALFFMNSPLVIESARHLLSRPDVACETDASKRVVPLVRLVLGRDPSPDETDAALRFLSDAAARPDLWNAFAQGLLSTNEFVFID